MSPWRRRPKGEASAPLRAAFRAYSDTLATVEEAKAALAAAAPARRTPGVPLAEAVAGFEWGLRRATEGMPSWRLPEVEEAWSTCVAALKESILRAQRFRMEDAPEGYERIYLALGELMDPLGAFQDALRRFEAHGI
jgi:hypothetical protein